MSFSSTLPTVQPSAATERLPCCGCNIRCKASRISHLHLSRCTAKHCASEPCPTLARRCRVQNVLRAHIAAGHAWSPWPYLTGQVQNMRRGWCHPAGHDIVQRHRCGARARHSIGVLSGGVRRAVRDRTRRWVTSEGPAGGRRYMADEARSLKAYGELPDNIRVNETVRSPLLL